MMELTVDVDSAAVPEAPEKKTFLKYTTDMECLLISTVLSSNAHKNSTKGTNEVKFGKVVDLICTSEIFRSKGAKRD